jgi:hypothetical protein
MPNLRIFDMDHIGSVQYSREVYHNLIHEFNPSFWTKKQMFFTHEHDAQDVGSGKFYSTNP